MPTRDEITEEGFGFFRGTWNMGRVTVAEAQNTVCEEATIIDAVDELSTTAEDFERLASALESRDPADLSEQLLVAVRQTVLTPYLDDDNDALTLDGLEVGVAGLTHALSAVRCLTAASCRSHAADHSWSDCPVVFFAAPEWRVELLAALISEAGCGLEADRDMLKIYAASIRDTHHLAKRILSERGRFRQKPTHWRPQPQAITRDDQMRLPFEP